MIKKVLTHLIICLLGIFIITSLARCKGSYVGGYQLDPDTTSYSTIFNEIYDQDSTVHWYVRFYEGELWCYFHNQYEEVRSVRR